MAYPEVDPKTEAQNQMELKRVMEPSSNHFAVRKTFLELQDSMPLKDWCGSMRRVKSCPEVDIQPMKAEPMPSTPEVSPRAKRSPEGTDKEKDESESAETAWLPSTPEVSPRASRSPGTDKDCGDELQQNASRTRLSGRAVPFQPPSVQRAAHSAHSTTYYAVPPVPRSFGIPMTPMTPMPEALNPFQPKPVPSMPPVPQVILGSAMLPSIGSGGHATGECKPCVFFHKKGCASGRTCLFCHLCQPGEKQRRKQEKSLCRMFLFRLFPGLTDIRVLGRQGRQVLT